MGKTEYFEKLKDPRWQRKRLEILNRDEFYCQSCYDDQSPLHVHHLYYKKDKEPWEYPNEAFLTLCESCHKEETEKRKLREEKLIYVLKKKGFLQDAIKDITVGFFLMPVIHEMDVMGSGNVDSCSLWWGRW